MNDCGERSSRLDGRQRMRRRGRALGLALLLWAVLAAGVYAAPPIQGSETIHVVQSGETLLGIAQKYGATVDVLIALNGLSDPNRIVAGQRLLVPSAGVQMAGYTVQPGDTLAIIARRYGVTVEEVARLNRLANPSLIYVGQRLALPSKGAEPTSSDSSRANESPAGALPGGGQVYVVQAHDTLARIATRHNVSVWALAQANQISNPSVIHVGQRLLIPTSEGSSSLPPPFVKLAVVPAIAVQGRTVQLWIETAGDASLSGRFDGRPLFFAHVGSQAYTLIPIPAMAMPGPYLLEIAALQGDLQETVSSMLYVAPGDFGVQYINLPADKAQLLDPELVAQESRRIQEVTAQPTLPGLWQGPFSVPLAGSPALSAPFGGRRSYNGGPVSSYHAGVDYSAGAGTPVLAPAPGKVVLADALQVRGYSVIVDHGRGVMSGYWHLSQINVIEGQRVEPGAVLGLVGSTGLSTGAHLHWELRLMGIPVDPLQWVREEIR